MTHLHTQPYTIPAADLGQENPLPRFRDPNENRAFHCDSSVPPEDQRFMGWQTGYRVLPYRMQDNYTRIRHLRTFQSVVLENDFLRATVLPELGGRLVSLFHKPQNRELLSHNPVFQPANLALRNAWFSGGIEWNMPHFGHHYLTCSPVFAAQVAGPGGCPILRLYEWDRVKRVPWQLDLYLPPNSPFLFAHIRLVNPHDQEIPMYWWTNIAVPEAEGIRVLTPAPTVLACAPSGLSLVSMPPPHGPDISYSTRLTGAQEYFFHLPAGQRPWVAALDSGGKGFVQCSTPCLRGRKMFCWGTGPGGRRWQEYLSQAGEAYLEIQAGLARTQLESVPMPGRARWNWTEAFGLLESDPASVHSEDWNRAWRAADASLGEQLPTQQLETMHHDLQRFADAPVETVLAHGSGWGALERYRLDRLKLEDPLPHSLHYGELQPDGQDWQTLLETGALPERSPQEEPGTWMVQEEWRILLEEALQAGRGDHWLSWLHLGVMRLEAFDRPGAREAWMRSLAYAPSAWAFRCLSVLEGLEGNPEEAIHLMQQAWEVGPPVPALAIEYAHLLLNAGRHDELNTLIAGAPAAIRQHERIRLIGAHSALETGRWQDVEPLFDQEFATIQEGEVTLTNIWFRFHEQKTAAAEGCAVDDALRSRIRKDYPPPGHIDFRA